MATMFDRVRKGRGTVERGQRVTSTGVTAGVTLLGANPNRVSLIFAATFVTLAAVDSIVLIGILPLTGANFIYSLTPGAPSVVLTFDQIGDLIYEDWRALSVNGNDGIAATEIVFRPEDA